MTAAKASHPPVPAHFRAVQLLGEGASAVTWLAHYDVTGQDVALKVWRSPLLDPAERERFVTECHWHSLLQQDPNVVGWVWASTPDAPHP